MPKTDITTKALRKAAARIQAAVAKVDEVAPYGPGIEKLTVGEQRKRLEGMMPDERNTLVNTMGMDGFMAMLQKIYSGQGRQEDLDGRRTDTTNTAISGN